MELSALKDNQEEGNLAGHTLANRAWTSRFPHHAPPPQNRVRLTELLSGRWRDLLRVQPLSSPLALSPPSIYHSGSRPGILLTRRAVQRWVFGPGSELPSR